MIDADVATGADELNDPAIVDVWSRTAPKYRVRAIVLLIINLFLFAGLGCFAYWLRTGDPFAPAMEDYWGNFGRTFLPRGEATLANFVLFPIRLDWIPIHGVVVGLLLAALVSIPILISILYRFRFCIPFILVVAFLAVMPWLAINLVGACILASVKPFRLRFRYASALLGLLLVMLYFYGASRQTAPTVEVLKPQDRIYFMAPWILATIASCVIMGGVLLLARLVNYRPGVVAPLLLIAFAVPVGVFEKYVGRHELYYRLLEQEYKDTFHDRDVHEWFDQLVHEAWLNEPEDTRPTYEAYRDLAELRLGLELDADMNRRTLFAEQRDKIVAECDRFIRFFPDSRYAPCVLYIKGRTLDMRVDLSAFRGRKIIRFYDDFPSHESEIVWLRLLANAPEATIACVGRFRLAQLMARRGAPNDAIHILDELISRYDSARAQPVRKEPENVVAKVLNSAPADEGLGVPVKPFVFEAKQLLALLLENGKDPLYGLRPLSGAEPGEPRTPGLFTLDPRHSRFAENLRRILAAYPDCLLADNLSLMIAKSVENRDERVAMLEECEREYPNGDAVDEARFRLGAEYQEMGLRDRAREQFEAVLQRQPPSTIWESLARDRLRTLSPEAAP